MSNMDQFDLIALAFAACNMLRLASYIPQIIAVTRDRNRAAAISISCWSIWICANAATGAYAWVNLGDLSLSVVAFFNAACCTIVVVIAARKRLKIEEIDSSAVRGS